MSQQKLLAFIKNPASISVVKELANKLGLKGEVVIEGDINTASQKLSAGTPSPEFLLVELADKDDKASFASLDNLANYCEPKTNVIICGDIDALSFYKELMNMGVNEYILNPIKPDHLTQILAGTKKTAEAKAAATDGKRECKIISIIGTRGGVGCSTIALNMAEVFANNKFKTAILDFDAEFGTIPLMLDLEPSKGMVEALEKPERIDSLFLDRVMSKVSDHLFVMGAEKNLSEIAKISEKAAEVLLKQLQAKFDYIIVDVPTIEQYDHYILQHGEDILITELSIAGLRDSMRIFDFINEKLGNKKITFVANKTGLNKKFETTVKDFETGLRRKIDFIIPFEQEIYGFANTGKIQVDDAKSSKFAAAIQKLAAKFLPNGIANAPEPAPKPKGFMSKILKK